MRLITVVFFVSRYSKYVPDFKLLISIFEVSDCSFLFKINRPLMSYKVAFPLFLSLTLSISLLRLGNT